MAVKKTTKKAAKKTYPSAKKTTLPKLKKTMTVEELAAVMAEGHAKVEAAHAQTEAAIADLAKGHAKVEAAHAQTEAAIRKLSAANEKSREEMDRVLRELSAEVQETSAAVRELNETLGGMGGHLGEVIEFIVVPKIRPAINALGNHAFKDIMAKKIVSAVIDNVKRKLAEMDVFLCGDTEAMAVEIKTCLQIKDVDKHLTRLQKLRDHEVDADIKGKALFGAVVGAIVHHTVKTYALKNGLYVVEIREEEDKLDIEKPDMCRTW